MAIDINKFKGTKAKEKLDASASAPRQPEGEGNGGGYGIFDLAKAPYEVKNWKPKNVVVEKKQAAPKEAVESAPQTSVST